MRARRRLIDSFLQLLAIAVVAVLAHVATFSRVGPVSVTPTVVAATIIAAASIGPHWLAPKLTNGAAFQLFCTAFRLGILLPSLVLAQSWQGDERNCFVTALLACYFVVLPLESWLRIRAARETDT